LDGSFQSHIRKRRQGGRCTRVSGKAQTRFQRALGAARMEPMKNTFEIVSMFVDRINAHDADGLYALMEEDHVFIDALGRCVKGREAMRTAWQAYFAMVPDYWIKVDRMLQQETVVAIFGKAGGTVADDGRL